MRTNPRPDELDGTVVECSNCGQDTAEATRHHGQLYCPTCTAECEDAQYHEAIDRQLDERQEDDRDCPF
jgi:uncharacterized Zn finger protein (UPF0148 family)